MASSTDKSNLVPLEIYKGQVDAMYMDVRSLCIGSIAASSSAICVSVVSGSPYFVVIGVIIGILGGVRLFGMSCYRRQVARLTQVSDLQKWEDLYVIGAAIHVALMGIFCLTTFVQSNNEFGRIMSTAAAMAYFVGIPGRNFASNKLVNTLIACGSLPMIAALFLAGGHFWLISLSVFLPFFVAMRNISFRLRDVYLGAVLKARDMGLLAERFDAALNNMPHGLVMSNKSGRVIVINQKLNELLRINIDIINGDYTLTDLFREAKVAMVLDNEIHEVESEPLLFTSTLFDKEYTLDLFDERTLSVKCQPMGDGGAVFVFEDITERKNAQQRINQLARFDSLTGLPNRAEFLEQAAPIIMEGAAAFEVALMFLDLDQFKQVNDTLGHSVGDLLLCQVAKRLSNLLEKDDLIARFGGDEFVILLPKLTCKADAQIIAAKMIEELSKPYQVESHLLQITASIGISFAPPSSEVGSLLRDADLALYQAKADGRGTSRVFEFQMEEKVRTRRLLELDLREALSNDRIELYYQPIYNIRRGRFTVCEALLRWKHASRGWIPPSVFVPLAEEMGLIRELDDWVLRRACRDCSSWPQGVRVAVNISAVHFRDTRLVQSVLQALEAGNLPPERLCIEITETAVLSNLLTARSTLSKLSQSGIQIALDDFGTGYSSLSYLHSLPLNKVKIDRAFLRDLRDSDRVLRLLAAVAKLSTDLGLEVVIEGVESQDEFALISKNTQVDEIQGYLFSRPVPAAAIETLLETKIRFAA